MYYNPDEMKIYSFGQWIVYLCRSFFGTIDANIIKTDIVHLFLQMYAIFHQFVRGLLSFAL